MKMSVIMTCLVGLMACQTPIQSASILKQLPKYKVEALDPPVEDKELLPPKTMGGAPIPLRACEPPRECMIPFTGILLDSHLLAKYKLIKGERDKLRTWIMIERTARGDIQNYMNKVLADALARAKRSWWDENKGWVGLVGGVVAASILAIGLAAGLERAERVGEE